MKTNPSIGVLDLTSKLLRDSILSHDEDGIKAQALPFRRAVRTVEKEMHDLRKQSDLEINYMACLGGDGPLFLNNGVKGFRFIDTSPNLVWVVLENVAHLCTISEDHLGEGYWYYKTNYYLIGPHDIRFYVDTSAVGNGIAIFRTAG